MDLISSAREPLLAQCMLLERTRVLLQSRVLAHWVPYGQVEIGDILGLAPRALQRDSSLRERGSRRRLLLAARDLK